MDVVKFVKSVNRLCKNQSGCAKCPIWEKGMCMIGFDDDSTKSIEETVSKVEQWAKDNPVKTRKSEFQKMFPNAYLGNITRLLPCSLDKTLKPLQCAKYGYLSITCRCDRCRDDYWNEEVSE